MKIDQEWHDRQAAREQEPKRKVTLDLSWTEVTSRSTTVEVELTEDEIDDLEMGYGFGEKRWLEAVREKEGYVEMLHDEVDHIEVKED